MGMSPRPPVLETFCRMPGFYSVLNDNFQGFPEILRDDLILLHFYKGIFVRVIPSHGTGTIFDQVW